MRALVAVLVLVAACSSNSQKKDAEEFRDTAQQVSAAADQHLANMATVASMDACQTELTRYGDQIRPLVENMMELSGSMDSCAGMMGSDDGTRAMCDTMMSDLDRHMADGCASMDMGVNQTEASRHAGVMMNMASKEAQMGSGMMGEGSMMCGG